MQLQLLNCIKGQGLWRDHTPKAPKPYIIAPVGGAERPEFSDRTFASLDEARRALEGNSRAIQKLLR